MSDETAIANKAVDNVIGFKSDDGNFDNINLFNSGSASAKKKGYFITLKYAGSTIGRKQGYFITLKSDRSAIANKTVDNVNDFRADNGKQGNKVPLNAGRSANANNRVDNIKSIVGRSAIANKTGRKTTFKSCRRDYFVMSKNAGSTSAKSRGDNITPTVGRSAIANSSYNVMANPSRGDIVTSNSNKGYIVTFFNPSAIANSSYKIIANTGGGYIVTPKNGGAL